MSLTPYNSKRVKIPPTTKANDRGETLKEKKGEEKRRSRDEERLGCHNWPGITRKWLIWVALGGRELCLARSRLAPEVTILTPLPPHTGPWSKGLIDCAFAVIARTGGSDRANFSPFAPQQISVLPEDTCIAL